MPASVRLDDAHGWKHRKRSWFPVSHLCRFIVVRGVVVGARVGFGMLLGPEGTSPALGAGFVVSGLPGTVPCTHTGSWSSASPCPGFSRVGPWVSRGCSPGFSGGGVVGWLWMLVGGLGCGGLVGVCELDSGCEHLVVMFCGLFECVWCVPNEFRVHDRCVLSDIGRTVDALAPRADEGRGRPR